MSTPAIPKQVTLSPLYKLLCLEAAALEAADILPKKLNDQIAAVIEPMLDAKGSSCFEKYTAEQREAVVKLKDSTAVFGLK